MNHANFKKKIRRFLAAGIAAMLFTVVWNDTKSTLLIYAEEETQGSLNVAYHTQEEISTRIKNDEVTQQDSLDYMTEPLFASPYNNAGTLTQDTLDNAIKMMNQIRYIAGLQDDVTLKEEYNQKAQAAAYVNFLNKSLSHFPTKPNEMENSMYQLGYDGASSSNIAMASWKCSFNWTIVQSWMKDGDSSNIDRMGHRRWILNPSMGQTGFGAVYGSGGTYSALYCFDRTRSASETQVAWPAQNMPIEYFNKDFPWSISMGTKVDKDMVHVTLKRVNDNKIWNFSTDSSDGYFNVNNDNYGQIGCIIFRPEEITEYQTGDSFEVSITGNGINLNYMVNFFDPNNITPEDSDIGKEILNSNEQETVANAAASVFGSSNAIASIEKTDSGICITSKSGDIIYSKTNGNLAINEWIKVNTNWYYFDADKKAAKGWKHLGSDWYYLDNTSSKMLTGWKKTETGNWYYFDSVNGNMKTNWQLINNQWYYLDSVNGNCLTNTTTPDGYTVDENGVLIQ